MLGYRLHYLDCDDRVLAFEEIEAPGDRDALQAARAKARRVHNGPWDLWIGNRCVHRAAHDTDPWSLARRRPDPEPMSGLSSRRSIWAGAEPPLDEVMQDYAVRALMAADRIEAEDVFAACRGRAPLNLRGAH